MRAMGTTARLLAATAICCAFSARALAQDYGLESTDGTPITNPAGTTIEGAKTGILSTGEELNLDNAGTIRGDGLNGSVFNSDGGIIVSGGPAYITNSGDISGARFGISTIYHPVGDGSFEGLAIGSAIDNSGSIVGESDDGIRLIGGGTVTNSGYIAGQVGAGADGISIFPYTGQDTSGLASIGSVTNLEAGVIEGNRFGVIIFGPGSIDNAGTIDHTASIQGTANFDPLRFAPGQTGTINNSGTILNGGIVLASLDTGIVDNSGHTPTVEFAAVTDASLTNSGTIDYFASFSTVGNATVENSGSIGEGLIFNQTGTANVTNSGTITATDTPDVVGTTRDAVYSEAALTLTNTATGSITGFASGIQSSGASLTLNNAGTIRGNGNSSFFGNSDGGVVLQGGPGFITNSGSISGLQFGITTIYVSTDPFLGLAIGSTVDNSGSIIGENNDGIRLIGGGTVINSGYIAGQVGAGADGISMFSFEGQDLDSFDVIGSVTNLATGVIEGNRFGVILSNGGIVDNAGTITGNAGSILLQAQAVGSEAARTGTVTNSGTLNGVVQFNNLASATVDNSGSIGSATGPAIHTTAPSGSLSVTNEATGSITGAGSGIFSEGSSLTVDNAGTIRGNGSAGGTTTPDGGIVVTGGPATITNTGTISGQRFGITTAFFFDPETNDYDLVGRAIGSTVTNSGSIIGDTDDGVRLIGGGTVTNSGYIAGLVGSLADGISMFAYNEQPTGPTIGTVNNLAGGIIEGHRFGIILSGGGEINNAGTINGGTNGAILIQTGFVDGKTGAITNSGTINGTVQFNALESATVDNSGSIIATSGQAVHAAFGTGDFTVTNAEEGSIEGAKSGIFNQAATFSLVNHGTIRGNGTYDGFEDTPDAGVTTSGPATIQNYGSITGQRFGITTIYNWDEERQLLQGLAIGSTIENHGTIIGETDIGIRLIGGGTVINDGYIAGRVGPSADGVWMMAFNDQPLDSFSSIGSVINLAGGVIEGDRRGVTLANGGTVDNAGTISGIVSGIRIVALANDPGRTGAVTNSGTINGGVEMMGLADATIDNSGSIAKTNGAAIYSNSPHTLTNSPTGSITGSTRGIFDEGPSLSIDNAGTIRGNGNNGSINNPDGGIIFTGGPADITNSGTISGQQFGISTALYLNPVTNQLEPRAIGSTVENSGSIIGDNNDGVRLIGGGTVTNSGYIAGRVGSLADGISMFAHSGQDTSGFTGIGSVTNLAGGVIEGNRFGVILSSGGSVDNAGTISGTTSGGILIQGDSGTAPKAGSINNSGTINNGTSFFGLTSSSLTNSGTINGVANSFSVIDVTVDNSGTITGTVGVTNATTGTVTNSGSVEAFTYFNNVGTASLDNSGTLGDFVQFSGVGSGSLTNSGSISAGLGAPTYTFGSAVFSDSAVTLTNTDTGSIVGDTGILSIGPSLTLDNAGWIAGSGSYGVSLKDGSVTNLAGGTISGASVGIYFVNGFGSVNNAGTINVTNGDAAVAFNSMGALAPSTVVNSGTINGSVQFGDNQSGTLNNSGSIVARGSGVAVWSIAPTTLVNSGTISTTGTTAVSLLGTNTSDTVTLLTGSSITGAVDGGTGTDSLILSGTVGGATPLQTVGNFLNFENLNVLGGYWTAPGNLAFNSTVVSGGTLAVNGTLTSPIGVNAGAVLGGTGTISGNVTINSGGVLNPGNGIGTINVTGNVTFGSGSIFRFDALPTGQSDKLAATGTVTIGSGSTLQVLGGSGTWNPKTSFTVLTASSISGKFSSVTSNLAFLSPQLATKSTSIVLTLTRNGKPITSAATAETFSTASAISGLAETNPIYSAILFQSESGAQAGFSALSGSGYDRLDAMLAEDFGELRLGFDEQATAPALGWTGANPFRASGFHSGSAFARGPVSVVSIGGAYARRLTAANMSADVETRFLANAVGYRSGRLQALAGLTTAWHDGTVTRTVSFPGFFEQTRGRELTETQKLEGQVSYALSRGDVAIAPYAGLSSLTIKTRAFAEMGGYSALSFDKAVRSLGEASLGLRLGSRFSLAGMSVAPHLDLALHRRWGDLQAHRSAEFVSGSQAFDSIGSGFDSRQVSIDAGLDLSDGPLAIAATYRGRIGDVWSEHGAMLSAKLRF